MYPPPPPAGLEPHSPHPFMTNHLRTRITCPFAGPAPAGELPVHTPAGPSSSSSSLPSSTADDPGAAAAPVSFPGASAGAMMDTTDSSSDDDKNNNSNSNSNTRTKKSPTSGLGVGNAGRGTLRYSDYLHLDQLLGCQRPLSFAKGNPCHDEMLFITIHQTYELWFKQLIFELDSVRSILAELNIGEKLISLALHRLGRIREIQKLLNDQIKVLDTMMPQEFLEFRDYLFPASGFQSLQFRLFEVKLGVSPEQRLNARWILNVPPADQEVIREAQQEPSLFDYVERWLRNIPFREFRGYNFQSSYEVAVTKMFQIERDQIMSSIEQGQQRTQLLANLDTTMLNFQSVYCRDVHEQFIKSRKRRMGFRATSASLMIMLYQDEPMLQLPARFLKTLIDVDEQMNQWRYNHAQMVHRMIGIKVGTGGSLGHSYLKQTIDSQRVFEDLANLSTLLIPRRLLPPLPSELSNHMKYFHSIEKYDRTLFEMGGGGDVIDWTFC